MTYGRDAPMVAKWASRRSRFDFAGLGHSEGELANTDFSSNIGDLVAAAGFLRVHYAAPLPLIGHSLGGAAVLVAAGKIAELRAVAMIGAPADPVHIANYFDVSAMVRPKDNEVGVQATHAV
jgi:pimeloyl-ACP methyl ester carboxylesterase